MQKDNEPSAEKNYVGEVAECDQCHGSGEIFTHRMDCYDDLCALNGDGYSCTGVVLPCPDCTTPSSPREGVEELFARMNAARKRLGDAKAIHSQWYTMPKYQADQFAADNMNNIEQIIYSAICYLDGIPGQYLPASQTSAPDADKS